jgi:hypothetical protein
MGLGRGSRAARSIFEVRRESIARTPPRRPIVALKSASEPKIVLASVGLSKYILISCCVAHNRNSGFGLMAAGATVRAGAGERAYPMRGGRGSAVLPPST